mmetsp:Transcript_7430/g.28150  ORF Transcript_7430/g.28150 Transcript_7430/m.28150 type:complete len:316 (+) Transcript_7430:1952-2899(+)
MQRFGPGSCFVSSRSLSMRLHRLSSPNDPRGCLFVVANKHQHRAALVVIHAIKRLGLHLLFELPRRVGLAAPREQVRLVVGQAKLEAQADSVEEDGAQAIVAAAIVVVLRLDRLVPKHPVEEPNVPEPAVLAARTLRRSRLPARLLPAELQLLLQGIMQRGLLCRGQQPAGPEGHQLLRLRLLEPQLHREALLLCLPEEGDAASDALAVQLAQSLLEHLRPGQELVGVLARAPQHGHLGAPQALQHLKQQLGGQEQQKPLGILGLRGRFCCQVPGGQGIQRVEMGFLKPPRATPPAFHLLHPTQSSTKEESGASG